MVEAMAPDRPRVVIDEKQVITRQGKQFVLYAGLLDAAHRNGLTAIATHMIESPRAENKWTAIVGASVTFPWGQFDGIGDANEGNVGRMIAAHSIRMAETRAKARALRDALNVGMAAVEELAGLPTDVDDDDFPDETHHPEPRRSSGAAPRRVQAQAARPEPRAVNTDEEREKYERLAATAKRLGLPNVVELALDAPPSFIVQTRNELMTRVNAKLAAQRQSNGASA